MKRRIPAHKNKRTFQKQAGTRLSRLKMKIKRDVKNMNKVKEKGKGFFGEFKEFALRGNVIDLAVGVIIGGAFQSIVNSVVNDLIMPLVGLFTGGMNFNDQFLILKMPDGVTADQVTSLSEASKLRVTTFNYGSFITAVINFLIMAFVIFMLVKMINRLARVRLPGIGHKTETLPAPTTKKCPYCKSEIDIEASRCPHCTSVLAEESTAENTEAGNE